MKSANIINRVIIKSIIFVIGLTIGVFSANAFYKIIFSSVDSSKVIPLLENVKDFELSDYEKQNCLRIRIEADIDGNLLLNGEKTGTLKNFDTLTIKLREVFKAREENGVFVEFSNEIEKEVVIVPNSTIKDADLYDLAEALELSGANPIFIDWNNKLPKPKIYVRSQY